MLDDLRADIRRFHRSPDPLSILGVARLLIDHFGLQALVLYRIARALHVRAHRSVLWAAVRPLGRWAARASSWLYGIYLDPAAEIGPGLYIGHSGGVHVAGCRLGAGCSIHQRVRITPSAGSPAGPLVGDRVWIGCHATIEGTVRIGDGVTLGAGAVVTRDVPQRCLVVGDPARVIHRDYDNTAML